MAHKWVENVHERTQKTLYLCTIKQLKHKDYGKVYQTLRTRNLHGIGNALYRLHRHAGRTVHHSEVSCHRCFPIYLARMGGRALSWRIPQTDNRHGSD